MRLPRELKSIEIHTIADLHIGDPRCDLEAIKRKIDTIASKDNAYCIINGDICNNAVRNSVSDIYAEKISPMEQLATFIDLVRPLQGRILAMTQGNHEARVYKQDGIDLTEMMAIQLGIEERYSPTTAFVFLEFGHRHHATPSRYSIYSTHGTRGGRKEGAKAIQLADLASIVDADVYICAHTHLPMSFKEAFYRVDPTHRTVKKTTKLFVNTAAALDYGGYGDKSGFKPSALEYPIIELYDKHDPKMRCIL